MTETKTSWYVASTGNHQALVIDEQTGRDIAVCYDKKDAPLVAAAPDLLEACQRIEFAARCRESTQGDPCRLLEVQAELRAAATQARAAIAKAEGKEEREVNR